MPLTSNTPELKSSANRLLRTPAFKWQKAQWIMAASILACGTRNPTRIPNSEFKLIRNTLQQKINAMAITDNQEQIRRPRGRPSKTSLSLARSRLEEYREVKVAIAKEEGVLPEKITDKRTAERIATDISIELGKPQPSSKLIKFFTQNYKYMKRIALTG